MTEWHHIKTVPQDEIVIVTNAAHPRWQTFGKLRRTDNYTGNPAYDWHLWQLDRTHCATHWTRAPDPISDRNIRD